MRKLVAVIVVAALCGCGGTKYRVSPSEQRPAFTGEVVVFEKAVPDSVSYKIIGDFVMQKQWYGSIGKTSHEATKEAAAKGANGVLIEKTGTRVTAWSWASPYTQGKLLWIENYEQAKHPYLKPAPAPRVAKGSVDERLEQLDVLKQKGKVTEAEYKERRAAILSDL